MKINKVRKSFRNFLLSRIGKSQRDNEFTDTKIVSKTGEFTQAHKFVLAGLCPLLREALFEASQIDQDEIVVIMPNINIEILKNFVLLAYGNLSPDSIIEDSERREILELCQIFGMYENNDIEKSVPELLTNVPKIISHSVTNVSNVLEEEVTTEDVERLLNAVSAVEVPPAQPINRRCHFRFFLKWPKLL